MDSTEAAQYQAHLNRVREERIQLHRRLNDLDIEQLVVKWEHKLGIVNPCETPLHLRLDAILEIMHSRAATGAHDAE